MAGKKQHHVWQMLQRGFGIPIHGKHHIWVYRKGNEPKKTVTNNFGQKPNFYGSEGSLADSNITNFENSVQEVISNARTAADGEELDASLVAPIITHLEMRSAFLRSELTTLGSGPINPLVYRWLG